MPIPFQDVDQVDGLGSAGYLKLERSPDSTCTLGALFVLNARGEPLEFAYNRVVVADHFLWRPPDLCRYVERRLTTSLLSVCSHHPRLLLCLASEVDAALFFQDVRVELPVVRIGDVPQPRRRVEPETGEVLDEEVGLIEVAWLPAPPNEESIERRLFDYLSTHGLLHEPFDRAAVGLREVYGPPREAP